MKKNDFLDLFEEVQNQKEVHGTITFNMVDGKTHRLYNQTHKNFIILGNDVGKAKMGEHENGKVVSHMVSWEGEFTGKKEIFIDLTMAVSVEWEGY